MATAAQNGVVHTNATKHGHPYNTVTLVMWGIALSSHAILIPLFIREVVLDFKKHRSSSLFG